MFTQKRATLAGTLVLLLYTPIVSQSATSTQPPIVFEIVYFAAYSGEIFTDRLRIVADGRYVREGESTEIAKSGRRRHVFSKIEKQLEPEEVAELVSWAENPDFLNAQPEYYLAHARHGHSFTILYRHKQREKKLSVVNYSLGNEAERSKVPRSVLQLLKWMDPYYFESAKLKKE